MSELGDLNKQMDTFAIAAEEMRKMSEMLTGLVRTFVGEGWTEEQAREIVVASFVSAVRANR